MARVVETNETFELQALSGVRQSLKACFGPEVAKRFLRS